MRHNVFDRIYKTRLTIISLSGAGYYAEFIMNRNDKEMLALAKKQGLKVTKKRSQKPKDDEKRLYDNEQERICNNLPRGRTVLIKNGEVL